MRGRGTLQGCFECPALSLLSASAICFGVASRGNTVNTKFDLESAGDDFGVVADISLVAGVSGGLLVLMR